MPRRCAREMVRQEALLAGFRIQWPSCGKHGAFKAPSRLPPRQELLKFIMFLLQVIVEGMKAFFRKPEIPHNFVRKRAGNPPLPNVYELLKLGEIGSRIWIRESEIISKNGNHTTKSGYDSLSKLL